MLLVITHLKAPWPAGSAVGDTVEFDAVPPWALGKCRPVEGSPEPEPAAVVQAEPEPEPEPAAKPKTKPRA